jgi:hypothetical protein
MKASIGASPRVVHIRFAHDADKLLDWVGVHLRLASISLADDARRVDACGPASVQPCQQSAHRPVGRLASGAADVIDCLRPEHSPTKGFM